VTWERLRDAGTLRIRFGEETITDLLLLELKRIGSGQIHIIQTPKYVEQTSGTDWEWWIGQDRLGWWRFAIQAKKLDSNTRRYDGLGHKVGGITPQMELLRQYAEVNHAIPLYCFYNYLPGLNVSQIAAVWHCCESTPDERQLGCTVTSLPIIDQASAFRGRKNFRWIHQWPQTLPWRCLVKCPRTRNRYQIEHIFQSEISPLLHRWVVRDGGESDTEEPIYKALPTHIREACTSGRLSEEFPEEEATHRTRKMLLPKRIAVFEYSIEEVERILTERFRQAKG